jgi:hypothetical protein
MNIYLSGTRVSICCNGEGIASQVIVALLGTSLKGGAGDGAEVVTHKVHARAECPQARFCNQGGISRMLPYMSSFQVEWHTASSKAGCTRNAIWVAMYISHSCACLEWGQDGRCCLPGHARKPGGGG